MVKPVYWSHDDVKDFPIKSSRERLDHPDFHREIPKNWNPKPASPRLFALFAKKHPEIEPIGKGGANAARCQGYIDSGES